MWLMKARCGSTRCKGRKRKKRKEKGAFLTQKESSSAALLESQTDLWWVKYMAHGSGRLRGGDLFLKSMPQILFSFFFFVLKPAFMTLPRTRHNRSLQLYILQPARTLRRSRAARCKYFPLLRSYRKEPSNHQLRPRTIRMRPRFFFFFQNLIFHKTEKEAIFFTWVTRSPWSPCWSYRGSLPASLSLSLLSGL